MGLRPDPIDLHYLTYAVLQPVQRRMPRFEIRKPVKTVTVGSSSKCTIQLNQPGLRPNLCKLVWNAVSELMFIVPEEGGRVLVNGRPLKPHRASLIQNCDSVSFINDSENSIYNSLPHYKFYLYSSEEMRSHLSLNEFYIRQQHDQLEIHLEFVDLARSYLESKPECASLVKGTISGTPTLNNGYTCLHPYNIVQDELELDWNDPTIIWTEDTRVNCDNIPNTVPNGFREWSFHNCSPVQNHPNWKKAAAASYILARPPDVPLSDASFDWSPSMLFADERGLEYPDDEEPDYGSLSAPITAVKSAESNRPGKKDMCLDPNGMHIVSPGNSTLVDYPVSQPASPVPVNSLRGSPSLCSFDGSVSPSTIPFRRLPSPSPDPVRASKRKRSDDDDHSEDGEHGRPLSAIDTGATPFRRKRIRTDECSHKDSGPSRTTDVLLLTWPKERATSPVSNGGSPVGSKISCTGPHLLSPLQIQNDESGDAEKFIAETLLEMAANMSASSSDGGIPTDKGSKSPTSKPGTPKTKSSEPPNLRRSSRIRVKKETRS